MYISNDRLMLCMNRGFITAGAGDTDYLTLSDL